jgi:hypothetical protein
VAFKRATAKFKNAVVGGTHGVSFDVAQQLMVDIGLARDAVVWEIGCGVVAFAAAMSAVTGVTVYCTELDAVYRQIMGVVKPLMRQVTAVWNMTPHRAKECCLALAKLPEEVTKAYVNAVVAKRKTNNRRNSSLPADETKTKATLPQLQIFLRREAQAKDIVQEFFLPAADVRGTAPQSSRTTSSSGKPRINDDDEASEDEDGDEIVLTRVESDTDSDEDEDEDEGEEGAEEDEEEEEEEDEDEAGGESD